MQPCDRCGSDVEELIAQSDGQLFCRPCHLGLGSGFDMDEYNRLRIMYDADPSFKKLRHRFWALGLARRFGVLLSIGYAIQGETPVEKVERFRLYKIKQEGKDGILTELIEQQEAEIAAENEKSDYIQPKDIPMGKTSGRAHAGKAELRPQSSNPNPWADSQE